MSDKKRVRKLVESVRGMPKTKDDKFWAKVREWQKDPKFRRAVREFVKRTTS